MEYTIFCNTNYFNSKTQTFCLTYINFDKFLINNTNLTMKFAKPVIMERVT